MDYGKEFEKYATKHHGINSTYLGKITSSLTPYIMEERQMNITQMDVFSRLMMERIIFLGTGINDQVANVIQAQLLFLESLDANKDISIYINSPGGSISAGLAIYDTMQFISSSVSTLCIGQAASMGALLLAGGDKGKRFVLPNSRVMIHQPLGGFQGQASDFEIHAKEILHMKKIVNEILAKHTGHSVKKIEKDTDRDNFLDADAAIKYGIVDKVLNERDQINGK